MNKEKIDEFEPEKFIKNLGDKLFFGDNGKTAVITIITSVVTAFLCYFMLMVNGYGGPDTVVEGIYLYNNFDWAIGLGRWFLAYAERYATNNTVIPFLIVIMYSILVGISAYIICRMMKIKSHIAHLLITAAFVSFPIVSYQFTYIYMAVYYAYAFFCSVMGILLIRQRKIWGYIVAAVLFVMMLGSYQSYICAVATIAVMLLIIDLIDGRKKKDAFIDLGATAAVGVIAAIADLVIMKLTFIYENIGASDRVGSFSLSDIFENIGFSFKYAFIWFFTYFWNDRFFSRNILYMAVLLLTAVAFIFCLVKLIKKKKIAEAVLICAGLYLIPHCMNLIQYLFPHNGVMNIMRYQYVCLFAFMVALVIRCDFKMPKYIMQWAMYLMMLVMINTYVLSANVTGIALKILYNETYTEASAMLQRVYEIDGYEKNRTKVILATPISVDTSNQEFKLFIDEGCYSGGPVFWGGYLGLNVSRRNYFINYLGVDPGYITEAEYNYVTTTEEYSEMPFWPAAGSVKMIDGYIVIKNKN